MRTVAPTNGAPDEIDGGPGNNIMLGGAGDDSITAEGGDDAALGDHGEVFATFTAGTTTVIANTTDPGTGDEDVIDVGDGDNVVLGGDADDDITSGDGDDVVLGDHGAVVATFAAAGTTVGAISPFDWSPTSVSAATT